jgi:hypothetical protein
LNAFARLLWSSRVHAADFKTNSALHECGHHVWEWISRFYGRDAAMLIRRELDKQAGAVNLRHLLHDIEQHFDVRTSQSKAYTLPDKASVVRRDKNNSRRQPKKSGVMQNG